MDTTIISLKIIEGDISLQIGPVIYVLIGLILIILLSKKYSDSQWDVVEAEVSLGAIGKIKIKPNFDDAQIAHKAWVELATRKAGLPFDEENDVIIEVYNSWNELFKEIRALTKQIPSSQLRERTDTQELVRLLVNALNLGLRPHLTKWQAKFRRWYEIELTKQGEKSPQEIQRAYSEYNILVVDLKIVSNDLVRYSELIRRLAQGTNQI